MHNSSGAAFGRDDGGADAPVSSLRKVSLKKIPR
jgi:hypothetical protein